MKIFASISVVRADFPFCRDRKACLLQIAEPFGVPLYRGKRVNSGLLRCALALVIIGHPCATASADEPRKNGGWTTPLKFLTVECVCYVSTVAERITVEHDFVPYQAFGPYCIGCMIVAVSVYLGRRKENLDIFEFRKIRRAIRAAAKDAGTVPLWTAAALTRSNWLTVWHWVFTLLLYLGWIVIASEYRGGELSVRIKDRPPLLADWIWVAFWFTLFSSIGQGWRLHLLGNAKSLTEDLTDEQETKLFECPIV